jgi:hypothetical protein
MKNIICSMLVLSLLTLACGKKEHESTSGLDDNPQNTTETGTTPDSPASTQAETLPETETGVPAATAAGPAAGFSIKGIIAAYLRLQDALANDNAKAAAQAGKTLQSEFNKIDTNAIDAKKRTNYLDIAATAKEHAGLISTNASNIALQREHLAILSNGISNLVAAFKSDTKLYQSYCPMYNEGKGAIWISGSKEIRNPYYGQDMLSCGSVQKEF